MAVHRIRALGDPILRVACEPIERPQSAAVRLIADDLRDTLLDWRRRFDSGRGIAAPQIGAPIRLLHVELDEPWTLVNPEIVSIGAEDFEVWDDCFSFPDLWVRVRRAYLITVRYQDLRANWLEVTAEGDRAELLQHEIDHLDGILATDRADGPDSLCLAEEWNRRHRPAGRYGKPAPRSHLSAPGATIAPPLASPPVAG
ncbi:MAG: peptide deformylase [Gemmatimonadetes bacterium]|nr:peptide deformylase [Gemmatimonadota bacterium]